MTLLLDARQEADLARAAALLRAGELVAVPTETVYGLAADATQPAAVRAIFAAKQRPADHPLIVHIGDVAQLDAWAAQVPPLARRLAEHFWPGPLTLVLHKAVGVDPLVTGGRDTVALRVPAHPALRTLLAHNGLAVAAPSANPHKCLSPTRAQHVLDSLAGKLAAVLDGGDCTLGIESTILDLTGPQPQVLRSGPITASQISDFIGLPVAQPQHHGVAVPGNMPVHYRPRTPLVLKDGTALWQEPGYPVVRLALHAPPAGWSAPAAPVRLMPTDKVGYAQLLYRTLHEADTLNVEAIWVERPPLDEAWSDVHDRLRRASAS